MPFIDDLISYCFNLISVTVGGPWNPEDVYAARLNFTSMLKPKFNLTNAVQNFINFFFNENSENDCFPEISTSLFV